MEENQKKEQKTSQRPKLKSLSSSKNVLIKKPIIEGKSSHHLLSKQETDKNIVNKVSNKEGKEKKRKIIQKDHEKVSLTKIGKENSTHKKISFQTWLLSNNNIKQKIKRKKNSIEIVKKQTDKNKYKEDEQKDKVIKKNNKTKRNNHYYQINQQEKNKEKQVQQPHNNQQSLQNHQSQNQIKSQQNNGSAKDVQSSQHNQSSREDQSQIENQSHKNDQSVSDNQINQQAKSETSSGNHNAESSNQNQDISTLQHNDELLNHKQSSQEIQPQQDNQISNNQQLQSNQEIAQQVQAADNNQISKENQAEELEQQDKDEEVPKQIEVEQDNEKHQYNQMSALQFQQTIEKRQTKSSSQKSLQNQQRAPQTQQIFQYENQQQSNNQNELQLSTEQFEKEKEVNDNQNEIDGKQNQLNEVEMSNELKQSQQQIAKFVTEPEDHKEQQLIESKEQSIKNEQSIKTIKNQQTDWQQINSYERGSQQKTCKSFKSTQSSCQDYLNRVFNYYCKIHYAVTKGATFDQMQQKMKVMLLNNFMIFCKDFKIIQYVDRDKLVEVFKKNSAYQKYLNPEQFRVVIQKLSEIIFQKQPSEERFSKMLQFLQINNSFSFVKKMNELGLIFRFKNKRGIDVNILPKYSHKLTGSNGKTQEHINQQVKERYGLRKIIKQEQIQWYKNNRKNRVEQLYKNAIKKKEKRKQKQKAGSRIKDVGKDISHRIKSRYNKSCENLSHRSKQEKNSYTFINNLKKMEKQIQPYLLKPHRNSQKQVKLIPEHNLINPLSLQRQMKINKIIQEAKNQMLVEKSPRLSNSAYLNQVVSNNQTVRHCGTIKKQIAIKKLQKKSKLIRKNFINLQQSHIYSNGKQIVWSQINSINPSRLSSSKLKRYTKGMKETRQQQEREINQLVDLIGINLEVDEYLEKHLDMQSDYELHRQRKRII